MYFGVVQASQPQLATKDKAQALQAVTSAFDIRFFTDHKHRLQIGNWHNIQKFCVRKAGHANVHFLSSTFPPALTPMHARIIMEKYGNDILKYSTVHERYSIQD